MDAPVPTIKKKYSIEILEFAVISLGSSRTSTPTGMMGIFVSATDGSAFCNRNEFGQSRTPVPTNKRDNHRAFGD